MIVESGARWYALRVRQRHEKATAAALRNKGYDPFLPLYRARHRWSDRIAELELPLFPGYLFCRFDPRDRRAPIVSTAGVIQLVGAGGVPCPVDDAEIAAVQRILRSGLPAEPWPYLQSGAAVSIGAGALAGLEGIFVEAKKHHRLVVSSCGNGPGPSWPSGRRCLRRAGWRSGAARSASPRGPAGARTPSRPLRRV